jgi:glycosyltransferase involved in cell wall biosynthesis
MEKPLVSFVIGCYNQERFIREAVEGAFAQDYSPLEIIISDDCSTDRTFDLIRQMAAGYTGPHAVRLNRNERNLGIGAHFNRLMQLSKGELVVLAAGDDISLPERTEIVVRAWNDSERKATSISSKSFVIDAAGRLLGETTGERPAREQIKWVHERGTIAGFLRRRRPHAAGSSHAISRALIAIFDPLPETVTYEDTALSFRTVLAGGLFTFIDAPLIKYRRHEHNITFDLARVHNRTPLSFAELQEKGRIELDRMIAVYKNFSTDAARAMQQGIIPLKEYPEVEKKIRMECRRLELMRELLLSRLSRRWAMFCKLYCNTLRPRELLTQLPHLLPRSLYRTGHSLLNRA